jgi:hypothetical protein
MVRGILADINIQGQVQLLVRLMRGEPWREFWEDLHLACYTFADLGLARDTPDSVIWRLCQERELLLVTNNRNAEALDSLETTIRQHNLPSSLPVLTVADAEQLRHSREYADRVIEKLLDVLMRVEALRGTGRLYLP